MYQIVFQIIQIIFIVFPIILFMCKGKKQNHYGELVPRAPPSYQTPPTAAPSTGSSTGNSALSYPVHPDDKIKIKNDAKSKIDEPPKRDPEASINTKFEWEKGDKTTSVSIIV